MQIDKKALLFNLGLCLLGGGLLAYFTEVKWLAASFFIFAALFINGSIAEYEDARPRGFDNPDGLDTPQWVQGIGALRYWLTSLGVTAFAIFLGAFVQLAC